MLMGNMGEKKVEPETYIGDGVYASFDGYQIKLRTNRDGPDEVIYIEPMVYMALVNFAKKVWKREDESYA